MSEKNGYLPSRGREEFEEEFEHILFAKLEDEINRLGSGDLEQLIKETNKRIEIRLEQAKQKGGVAEHNALQNEKLAREVIDLTRQLVVSNAEERKQLIEKLARENVFLFPDAEDENGRVFSCETKMGIFVHFIRNLIESVAENKFEEDYHRQIDLRMKRFREER